MNDPVVMRDAAPVCQRSELCETSNDSPLPTIQTPSRNRPTPPSTSSSPPTAPPKSSPSPATSARSSPRACRLRDVAVLVRNLDDYAPLIDAAFREHNLPYFIDRRRTAAHHPLLQFVRRRCRSPASTGRTSR